MASLPFIGDNEKIALAACIPVIRRFEGVDSPPEDREWFVNATTVDVTMRYLEQRLAGKSHEAALRHLNAVFMGWYGDRGLEAGPYDVPPEPEAPKPTRPVVGRLRLEAGGFRDDLGFLNPVYAHAGDLLSVYVRDKARALAELDKIAAVGYHGARVWITLGCGPNTHRGCGPHEYWYGREVGPHVTPDYWGELRSFRDALVARQLRLVASQGDLTQIQHRREYAEQLAALDNEAPFIDFLDGGNEMWQNGEPDPRRLAEFVGWYAAAGGKALKTLTDAPLYGPDAPPPAEQFNRYSIPPADLNDVHSFRGGHSWNKRQHCWGYMYKGHGAPLLENAINSEPPGYGARVTATENMHELDDEALAMIAAGSFLGRMAFVWFSGQGVFLEGGLDQERGFEAAARVAGLLPADVMTFRHQTHSQPTPAGSERVLEGDGDKELRIDGRIADDGRFAFTIDGPPGVYRIPVRRAFVGELIHYTGERVPVEGRVGDTLTVSFTRGRLFVGKLV